MLGMSSDARKQRAYAILHQALRPYVTRVTSMNTWQVSDPLQVMIIQWDVFARYHTPSDLGIVKQLAAAQNNASLSSSQVDAIITSMLTLLTHANLPEYFTQLQQLKSNTTSELSSSLTESAAIVGGLMAAGYFGYKLFEGARSLLADDSDQNITQASISNNNNESYNLSSQLQQLQIQPQQQQTTLQVTQQQQQHNTPQAIHAPQPIEEDDRESPFMCPITLEVMSDPVITPQGICFEREAITDWLSKSNQCPVTHQPLSVNQLITCYAMRNAIGEYENMRKSMKSQLSASNSTQPILNATSIATTSANSNSSSNDTSISSSNNTTTITSSVSTTQPITNSSQPVTNSSQHATNSSEPATIISPPIIHPPPAQIRIALAPSVQQYVQIWDGSRMRGEDGCYEYPERSQYIVFPASYNYLVSRSTGFVVIQNRANTDVTLISREREATLWDPLNIGAKQCAEYVLRELATQGFDFRGWYCIEVPPDPSNRPIDLSITDFAMSGGGKGAWLRMGTLP